MIYIVSGCPRSGTSMMMEALIAGGMDAAWSEERQKVMDQLSDGYGAPDRYVFNDKVFELDPKTYLKPDFPAGFDGKLVKAIYQSLAWVKPCQASVVFMRRDRGELVGSHIAGFNQVPNDLLRDDFSLLMDTVVSTLRHRRGWRVTELNYEDVVSDPRKAFQRLRYAGWPIDVEAAAGIPDAARKRY